MDISSTSLESSIESFSFERYILKRGLKRRAMGALVKLLFVIFSVFALVGCASNVKVVGEGDAGEISKRTSDPSKSLEVLSKEIYGERGIYERLRSCHSQLSSRSYGGTGHLIWSEPFDPILDSALQLDNEIEKKSYLTILALRQVRLEKSLEECKKQIKDSEMELSRSLKVKVTEIPKAMAERSQIDKLLCDIVKPGVSLTRILHLLMGEGWLTFKEVQGSALFSESVSDEKGEVKNHVLRLNQWRLAFNKDASLVTEPDTHLESWLTDQPCSKKAGVWTNN